MCVISRISGPILWLGLALFIAHELDAIARHEWRLLPGFSVEEDNVARDTFVLLHIPLLAVAFWLMTHPVTGIRNLGRSAIAALLIIHAGLHLLLSGHELYEFEGAVAQITIYGASLAGTAYLTLRTISRFH